MRPKKPCSAAKSIFAIFVTFLLTSADVPTQAQAQKFKVLHTFHGWNGAEPVGGLVRDAAGNIYGTTGVGGSGNCSGDTGCGTAFKLDSNGKQIWSHKFNGKNGAIPYAGLLRDSSGNLFGTTLEGGDLRCNPPYGCGTVFKLDKTGQKETVLHRFTGPPDGYFPRAPLVEDKGGNLYGTTYEGGTDSMGTVFVIDTAGRETILHSFTGPPDGGGDGAFPDPGVIRDAQGNLYGVTFAGGAYGGGAAYEVSSGGEETLLYSFLGGDGAQPDSVLLLDAKGSLYGTTANGGNDQCGGTGCGVVFELSPRSGGNWTETVLYDFCSLTGCTDGQEPGEGPLVRDAAGNLYGTTYFGGAHRNCNGDACGVVFELGPDGKETVLHSFTGGTDGALPVAGVMRDGHNNLYGTTNEGGDLKCLPEYGGCGVVFKISP
jgi:uncharacterized repeat protein (TIGR03803 family)